MRELEIIDAKIKLIRAILERILKLIPSGIIPPAELASLRELIGRL